MNAFVSPILIIIAFVAISAVKAGNNTITDEIYFDIKVDDKKGNETWRGRFIIGLFGDVLPMSTFNFLALAKGYRHKKVPDFNCSKYFTHIIIGALGL